MANIKEKIQDKVIDCIALNGQGRLVVFKPENGVKDLVVEKRADYKKKTIVLNIYQRKSADNGSFLEDAGLVKNITAEKDFYLVFVYFDLIKQKVDDNFWVIPSMELGKVTQDNLQKYMVNQKNFADSLLKELDKKEK